MANPHRSLAAFAVILFLAGCKTTPSAPPTPQKSVTVNGTLFYPDDASTTYLVPEGAQIIGAGGADCRFVIENGGSVTAHSGTRNTYHVKSGGHFRGFAHPATDSKVTYEAGAVIEQEQVGTNTFFVAQ